MGPKWLLSEAILQSASFGFRGVHGGPARLQPRWLGPRAGQAGVGPPALVASQAPRRRSRCPSRRASTRPRRRACVATPRRQCHQARDRVLCQRQQQLPRWLPKMCVHRPRSRGPKPRGFGIALLVGKPDRATDGPPGGSLHGWQDGATTSLTNSMLSTRSNRRAPRMWITS